MAAPKTFSFRLSAEGGQEVVNTLKSLAANSSEAERALRTLTQASPQLASVQDGVQARVKATAAALKEATQEAGRFQQLAGNLSSAGIGGSLGGAFAQGGAFAVGMAAAQMAVQKVREGLQAIPAAGDAARAAVGRLASTLGDAGQAAEVLERLRGTSRLTGVSLADSAALFQRFSIAAKDIGATSDQVLRLTEGIQKFGIVSGASAQETQAATQQIAQALASGRLQGDELRSVLENMPQFAQALARELGTSVGNLRQMGADGKLTADVVFPAMLRAVQGVDEAFARMPVTMARAQQQFGAASDQFLAAIDKSIGLSDKLIAGLERAAKLVDTVRRGMGFATQPERLTEITAEIGRIDRSIADFDGSKAEGAATAMNPRGVARGIRDKLLADRSALLAEQQDILRQQREMERADREQALDNQRAGARTRSQQEISDLRDKLDTKLKAEKEYQDRVKQLSAGLSQGVIDEAEYAKLSALALEDRNKALEKGAKATKESNKETEDFIKLLREQAKEAQSVEEELDPVTAAFNRYNEQLRKIRSGVEGGFIDPLRGGDLEEAAGAKLTDTLNGTKEKTADADQAFTQFFANATSGFEDAIVRGERFSNVIQGIERDIARLILRMAVTEPLAAGLKESGIGSTITGWVKGLIPGLGGGGMADTGGWDMGAMGASASFATGGIMTDRGPLPLRRYAGGGVARTPQMAMFGEGATPEAYVPLPDGRSIPVNMRGGTGGLVVHQPITINVRNSNASPALLAATADAAAAKSRANLIAELNRGGALAKTTGRRR